MITTERDVFTGAHVTPKVKAALKRQAQRRNQSMSAFVYEAIKEKLEKDGVDLKEESESSEQDVPLPFGPH